MQNIKLFKPVIISGSLEDMPGKQKEIAKRLLENRQFLLVDSSGFHFIDNTQTLPSQYFYGCEAVIMYRQMLSLPDCSISSIPVEDIISEIYDYDELEDILFFLRNIEAQNNKLYRLHKAGVPTLIMQNEYLRLYEYVEHLQFNECCKNPVVRCFDIPTEDGGIEQCIEARSSLFDLGYYLSIMPALTKDTSN